MTRPEPSYLALGTEWPTIDHTMGLEAQALTHDALPANVLPPNAFTGDWLSRERASAAIEFAGAAAVHSRACTAPAAARSEEVAAAYKRAFAVLTRLSEATAAALCAQSCEVEWCDADGDDAAEPFASLVFRGAPPDGQQADDDGTGRLMESTIGSCHQCKRKTVIRRCERQRPPSASLLETLTDSSYVCRRAFCAACVKKYPPLDENGPDRSGIFCCPTCRGLCSCRACSRARAGGPKKLKGRPEKWIGRDEQGHAPSAAAPPAAAETVEEDGAAQAPQRECSGELLSLPDASDGEVAPTGMELDSSADQLAPASEPPPPSSRSCRARCPACQHWHKLRIAFCAPPEAAKVLVPYACAKCSRAFGLILSFQT